MLHPVIIIKPPSHSSLLDFLFMIWKLGTNFDKFEGPCRILAPWSSAIYALLDIFFLKLSISYT